MIKKQTRYDVGGQSVENSITLQKVREVGVSRLRIILKEDFGSESVTSIQLPYLST